MCGLKIFSLMFFLLILVTTLVSNVQESFIGLLLFNLWSFRQFIFLIFLNLEKSSAGFNEQKSTTHA